MYFWKRVSKSITQKFYRALRSFLLPDHDKLECLSSPSLMFVDKARSLLNSGAPEHIYMPVHIRLGWKGKQSSLLWTLVNYGSNFFTTFGPWSKAFFVEYSGLLLKRGNDTTQSFVTSFLETGYPFLFPNITKNLTSGLYYKYFTILIYDRNDSDQYYKTRIAIVIDNPSLS